MTTDDACSEVSAGSQDSLDRIEEDADMPVCIYFGIYGNCKSSWCLSYGHPYPQCYHDMMKNLLRRQRGVLMRESVPETERTCTMRRKFSEPVSVDHIQEYRCSKCGGFTYARVINEIDEPCYCARCRARVTKVENSDD